MNPYHDDPSQCSWSQHRQLNSREDGVPQDYPAFPEVGDDTETISDSEDEELLQYAIMLSLQDNKMETWSSGEASDSVTSTGGVPVYASNGVTNPVSLSPVDSTVTESSKLLHIPQEILVTICDFVFDGEDIVFSLRRDTQKLLLDWGYHLSILLVCRDLNTIAMQRLRKRETTVDLRQYHRKMMATTPCAMLSLEDLLPQYSDLASACTKLVVSQRGYMPGGYLLKLLPSLSHVELYDYESCRKTLRDTLTNSGRILEYVIPKMMKNLADAWLHVLQEDLSPNIATDLIFVCDTLICVPEHDNDSTPLNQTSENKEICVHTENWRSLLGMRCKECKNKRPEQPRQDPRYRTAKLRHSFLFNEFNREGIHLSKDWVVAGLRNGASFAFGDMLAIHCHEYCLELIERGETVGI